MGIYLSKFIDYEQRQIITHNYNQQKRYLDNNGKTNNKFSLSDFIEKNPDGINVLKLVHPILHILINKLNNNTIINCYFPDFDEKGFNEYTEFILFGEKHIINKNYIEISLFDLQKKYYKENYIMTQLVLKNKKEEKIFLITIYIQKENVLNILLNNNNKGVYSLEIIYYGKKKEDFELLFIHSYNKKKKIKLKIDNYEEIDSYLKFKNKRKIESEIRYKDFILKKEDFPIRRRYCLINIGKEDFNSFTKLKNTNKKNYNYFTLIKLYKNNKKYQKLCFENILNEIKILKETEIEYLHSFYNTLNNCLKEINLSNISGKKIYSELEQYKVNYEFHKDELNIYFSQNFEKIFYNEKPYNKEEQYQKVFELKFIAYSYLLAFINLKIFSFETFIEKFKQLMNKIDMEKEYGLLDRIKVVFTFCSLYLTLEGKTDIRLYKIKKFGDFSFIKGEIFFRSVIKDLDEYSQLFFIYLQLNSGIGINLYDNKTYYRISMIDIDNIKSHLLSLFPKYFFLFDNENIDDIALTCPNTLVESFNEKKIFKNDLEMLSGNTDSSMRYSLVQFHETGHGKYDGIANGLNSPRYFLNSSYEPIEQKTWEEDKNVINKFILNKNEENSIICYKGESGKCIDFYLYKGMPLVILCLINLKNLELLKNINLFTSPSLISLNKIIEEIINNQENIEIGLNEGNNSINMNKIQFNKKKYISKYEEMANIYFNLNIEKRKQLKELLYPKINTDDEEENKSYNEKEAKEESKNMMTRRSDYNIFMVSN